MLKATLVLQTEEPSFDFVPVIKVSCMISMPHSKEGEFIVYWASIGKLA